MKKPTKARMRRTAMTAPTAMPAIAPVPRWVGEGVDDAAAAEAVAEVWG